MRTTFLILSAFLLTACGDMGFESDTDSGLSTELTSPTESFDCGNLIREPGEECDSNDDLFKCVNCKKSRKIFINTNELFSGFDIGFKDLDQSCTEAAMAGAINNDFTWKARVSKNNENIKNVIFNSNGLYVATNYDVIAYSFEDLTDGTLNSPIRLDQFSISSESSREVWTGTNIDGFILNPNCDDWTSDLPESNGVYGISDVITGEWTNFGLGNCGRDRHIYCIENEYIGR